MAITYAGDFNGIRDTAYQMVSLGNQIGDRVYASENFAKKHMADWSDDAKDQYEIVKVQWNNAITKMKDILNEQAAPALHTIVDNMEYTEVQNQKAWQ
jgi:Proteins of 100 residues with WXG.